MIMHDILISIVVPIYNIEDYLEKCVESLLYQTYKNIEIILVDDGSTDSSGSICERYASKDPRIIVIHKKNEGLVSARKVGTNIASGSYVVNVDGDDWIDKNRIENLVKKGLSQDVDMVYMKGYYKEFTDNTRFINSNLNEGVVLGKSEIKERIVDNIMNCDHCFKTNAYPAMWLWAVKSSVSQKIQNLIPNNVNRAEDVMFNLLSLLSVESVAIVEECGYHYVQRSNSMMGNSIKLESGWRQTVRDLIIEEVGKIDWKLERIITFLTISSILLSDYKMIAHECGDFLYPYSSVRPNSKVVVYGAGNLGCQLVRFIRNCKLYSLCAWVDRNEKLKGTVKEGTVISGREALKGENFDYIVVAIYDYDSAQKVCDELICEGVSKEKIVLMDPNVISEQFIPVKYR